MKSCEAIFIGGVYEYTGKARALQRPLRGHSLSSLTAMEQRFQVAKFLHEGKIYNEILAETGASSATISRVNRTLQYGKGGYDLVFSRTEAPDGEEKA